MADASPKKKRQLNWDLLRSISMFMVVVVHSAGYVPQLVSGFDLSYAVSRAAIICDPVFFMLSGYFALRPLKCSLKEYYLKKVSSIVLPIVLYSIVLYVYGSWQTLSFGGYVSYATELFFGGWWFIPSLIPMLVIAPFLFKALEGLDDRWMLRLAKLLVFVYVWGVAFHVLEFIAVAIERPGMGNLLTMVSACVPKMLISSYFPVFCLGYVYRRLSGILSPLQKKGLSAAAIVAIAVCFVLAGIGVGGDDPDQIWVIAAFCLFFLFERVRIPEGIASKAIEWVAKRSYSVYLFQYTTIAVVCGAVYTTMVLGDVAAFPMVVQLAVWVLCVAGSYLLALAVASVLDPLLLGNTQRLYASLVLKRVKRPELESAGSEANNG